MENESEKIWFSFKMFLFFEISQLDVWEEIYKQTNKPIKEL